jgi:hypothetical protein
MRQALYILEANIYKLSPEPVSGNSTLRFLHSGLGFGSCAVRTQYTIPLCAAGVDMLNRKSLTFQVLLQVIL